MKTSRKSIFILQLFFCININAQKKINAEFSFGLRNSIGSDIVKIHASESNSVFVEYFSRKKFKYPYFNLLANILYPIRKNLKIGLQTGIYAHYLEQYSSSTKRTTISVPLQFSAEHSLFNIRKNTVGINAAGGIIFFSIDDKIEKYKNGILLNTSFFWITNTTGILKIGLEKQIDNVTFLYKYINPNYGDQIFKYSIKRLSLFVSYGIIIN